jgi:hypothetical protein
MTLFEVAIIQHPKKKKGKAKLMLEPVAILAIDEQAAAINTILDNADYLADIDRDYMEVLVRPFI